MHNIQNHNSVLPIPFIVNSLSSSAEHVYREKAVSLVYQSWSYKASAFKFMFFRLSIAVVVIGTAAAQH